MCNTWEVSIRECTEGKWKYVTKWRGESLLKAIIAMRILKKSGCHCVMLEWR
jgi:hypothetical protein